MNPPFAQSDVLFYQHKVLVVNKSCGLLTQGPPGVDSLELRLKQWLVDLREMAVPDNIHSVYLGVPHRLDRPASGAMVFATNKPVTRQLARQFELRQVEKTYWALVEGRVGPDEGEWVDFMRKIPDRAQSELVSADHPESQLAVLKYRVRRASDTFSWLEIRLETGRTHQIRLQSAARGHPLFGDTLYGGQRPFGPQTIDLRARWIALHSRSIRFRHPVKEQSMSFTAEPPSAWDQWIAANQGAWTVGDSAG